MFPYHGMYVVQKMGPPASRATRETMDGTVELLIEKERTDDQRQGKDFPFIARIKCRSWEKDTKRYERILFLFPSEVKGTSTYDYERGRETKWSDTSLWISLEAVQISRWVQRCDGQYWSRYSSYWKKSQPDSSKKTTMWFFFSFFQDSCRFSSTLDRTRVPWIVFGPARTLVFSGLFSLWSLVDDRSWKNRKRCRSITGARENDDQNSRRERPVQ
jgi:hypothetical protein